MPRPVIKAARPRLLNPPAPAAEEEVEEGGLYFTSEKENIQFIRTGCTLLDCVLGGGWPLGRVSNIVGDKATGKTLLAIEGIANFSRQYDGTVRYNEVESAFDNAYAAALGRALAPDELFEECDTVEGFYDDLETFLGANDKPKIYVLDSFDSLSSKDELARKMGDPNYGDGKAKKMSEFFRRKRRDLTKANCALIIVSQIRDSLNAQPFARKWTRAGGKALDFYASSVMHLATVGAVNREVRKIKRQVGVNVKAKNEKSKVGLPYRTCEFQITFGYGIEDEMASLEFLKTIGCKEQYADAEELRQLVIHEWYEIEKTFLPTRQKY